MLRSINLSISSKCTANCLFCPSDRGEMTTKKFMDLGTVIDIVQQIKTDPLLANVKKIEVSENGDPLLNPAFIEILLYIKQSLPNIRVNLFTNFALMNKEIAGMILENKLVGSVYTNIDSTRKEYYKIMKGLDLDKVIDNLAYFVDMRNEIYSELPITVLCIELKRYLEHTVRRLGASPIKLEEPKLTNAESDFTETEKELRARINLKGNDLISNSGVMLWAERNSVSDYRPGHCVNIGRIENEAFINADGNWYICCFDSKNEVQFGNVLEQSISVIDTCQRRQEIISLLKQGKYNQVGGPCNSSTCCEIS